MSSAPEAPWLEPAAIELAAVILRCHQEAFDRPLLSGTGPMRDRRQTAQELFAADTVVLAHDGGADPRFIYANRAALSLWRRTWPQMVGLPSRLSAALAQRSERSAALARARQRAIDDYSDIRVDSQGRRFRLEGARLFSLRNGADRSDGQAACFSQWHWI